MIIARSFLLCKVAVNLIELLRESYWLLFMVKLVKPENFPKKMRVQI